MEHRQPRAHDVLHRKNSTLPLFHVVEAGGDGGPILHRRQNVYVHGAPLLSLLLILQCWGSNLSMEVPQITGDEYSAWKQRRAEPNITVEPNLHTKVKNHRTGVVDTAVQKYSNKCTITHKRVRLKSFRMYQPPTPLPTDDVANELPPQTSTYSIIFDAKGWIYRRGRGQNENAVTHGNIISRENRSVHIFLLYYKKINQDTTQAHPCFGAAFCAPNHWWSLSACCPGERSLSTPGSFSRSTSVSSASMSVKLSSPKLALYVVTPQY